MTPDMFDGYHNDPEATEAAFDEQGFFETGDLAFLKENCYVLETSPPMAMKTFTATLIRGYEVSIPKIELTTSELPYVEESYVFLLPSTNKSKEIRHIAILMRTRRSYSSSDFRLWDITLSRLRNDLTDKHTHVFFNEMPTVLRVLGVYEYIPKTPSGRILFDHAIQMYFPRTGDESVNGGFAPGVQVWNDKEVRLSIVRYT